MALDKVVDSAVLDAGMTVVADAIRAKAGITDQLVWPEGFKTAVDGIQTGGGSTSNPLDPVEVYNNTRPSDWLPMPTPAENEMYLLFHIPDGVSSLLAFTVTCTGNYTVALGTVPGGSFVASSSVDIASGSKYEAELFADDYGNLTSDGHKQVMVKVSGTDILTWDPSTHSKKTSPRNFAGWNIIEISCNLPSGKKVRCGNNPHTLSLKKLQYFTWIGKNAVTNMGYVFQNCNSLTAIPQLDTYAVTDMSGMFNTCSSLKAIPQLDTSAVTNMNGMFNTCSSLTAIPQLDTSAVTNMSYMFNNCNSLTAIPQLDTSAVTNMNGMFRYCYALTAIPQMDTSAVTDMSSMFNNCYSLTAIPQLDTSAVTNVSYMFNNCNSLTAILQLDTSAVTNMFGMFQNCYSLTAVPQLDTSAVTSMGYMFQNCYSLTDILQLDTSAVTNMSHMFQKCYSLTAIPQLDTSAVTDMSGMFQNCNSLTSIALDNTVTGWDGYDIALNECSLGHTAIVAFFNSLPTITSAKAITLTGNPGVSELTDAEKAVATGKGWTLTL